MLYFNFSFSRGFVFGVPTRVRTDRQRQSYLKQLFRDRMLHAPAFKNKSVNRRSTIGTMWSKKCVRVCEKCTRDVQYVGFFLYQRQQLYLQMNERYLNRDICEQELNKVHMLV